MCLDIYMRVHFKVRHLRDTVLTVESLKSVDIFKTRI